MGQKRHTRPVHSIGEAADLPWPDRVPLAIGAFALSVGVVVALQRHEFTHPNWGLLAVVVMVTPWVTDIVCIGTGMRIHNPFRFGIPFLLSWSAAVLGGAMWLVAAYPVPNDFAPFFITILVGEMAATVGPKFGGILCAVSVGLLVTYSAVAHTGWLYIWGFAFIIGWMGGSAFRHQVQIAFQLSAAQTQLSEQAVADERRRLARDIHDLIAHSLAVTMLQLSGARLALQAGDRDEAMAALEDAEAAGRAAMAEIHRTVGLLGSFTEGTGQIPTPNAADLTSLVGDFRHAGLDVVLALEGNLAAVPLATGLASYRLVQESLSNAVKHAPGAPVRLQVKITDRDITITVVNPVVVGVAAGASGGNGLRGMTERAELLGGVVAAGNGDGNWKVEACLPWEAALS
jgi:signal transduction histidine kinase